MKRRQLPRVAAKSYPERLRWLRSAGLDVEIPVEVANGFLRLDQVGGVSESVLQVHRTGLVEVAAWLRVVPLKRCRPIECEILASWSKSAFLLSEVNTRGIYELPSGLAFPKDQVLNGKMVDGVLARGEVLEGVLLAYSHFSIPVTYQCGLMVNVEVCLTDYTGDEVSQGVELMVWRDSVKRPAITRTSQAAARHDRDPMDGLGHPSLEGRSKEG